MWMFAQETARAGGLGAEKCLFVGLAPGFLIYVDSRQRQASPETPPQIWMFLQEMARAGGQRSQKSFIFRLGARVSVKRGFKTEASTLPDHPKSGFFLRKRPEVEARGSRKALFSGLGHGFLPNVESRWKPRPSGPSQPGRFVRKWLGPEARSFRKAQVSGLGLWFLLNVDSRRRPVLLQRPLKSKCFLEKKLNFQPGTRVSGSFSCCA